MVNVWCNYTYSFIYLNIEVIKNERLSLPKMLLNFCYKLKILSYNIYYYFLFTRTELNIILNITLIVLIY